MADGVDPRYCTVEEAAVALAKSTSTVWRLIRRKRLPPHNVLGRTLLLRRDVDALAKALR